MPVTRADALAALRNALDGLDETVRRNCSIHHVDVDHDTVHAVIQSSVATSPGREQLRNDIVHSLREQLVDSKNVEVEVVFGVAPPRSAHADGQNNPAKKIENLLPDVTHVVLVGSGKGGVGKSTVAANIAAALSLDGLSVGLLDMDVYGPSIPTLLGIHEAPLTNGNMIYPIEIQGIKVMSIGLVIPPGQAVIWRGPMLHSAVRQFLGQVMWGALDVLVVDLPPGTGDVPLSMAQLTPVSGAVVVSTPQEVALADVRRAVGLYRQLGIAVLGLVENMAYFVCEKCGHVHDIFARGGAARAATEMGVPFLGDIPLIPEIRKAGDEGRTLAVATSPAGIAFQTIAKKLHAALAGSIGIHNASTLQPQSE